MKIIGYILVLVGFFWIFEISGIYKMAIPGYSDESSNKFFLPNEGKMKVETANELLSLMDKRFQSIRNNHQKELMFTFFASCLMLIGAIIIDLSNRKKISNPNQAASPNGGTVR